MIVTEPKTLSIIIPALDESTVISETIASILNTTKKFKVELIVVDNGSKDSTCDIATKSGAFVYRLENATIAALRNKGVEISTGSIIVFIDADVKLADSWGDVLADWLDSNDSRENFHYITGSRCEPLVDGNYLNMHWFKQLKKTRSSYINSGHMITTRDTFNIVGGFDESLVTSEDYDFCKRAISKKISVNANQNLLAYHFGYPKTIRTFIKRELWHGSSDVTRIKELFASRTALASISFLLSLMLGTLLGIGFTSMTIVVIGILGAAVISAIFVLIKFERVAIKELAMILPIACVYLATRGIAVILALVKKEGKPPRIGRDSLSR